MQQFASEIFNTLTNILQLISALASIDFPFESKNLVRLGSITLYFELIFERIVRIKKKKITHQ